MSDVHFEREYIKNPAGSCLSVFGDTKVICTATIEDERPPFLRNTERGWLTAEYAMLPGSTGGGRKPRAGVKRDGRGTEIQRLIGRSLRASVDLDALGPVAILIDCDVLQADGGTRTAAISGGWHALYDALRVLARRRADMNVVKRGEELVEIQGTGEGNTFDRAAIALPSRITSHFTIRSGAAAAIVKRRGTWGTKSKSRYPYRRR